MALGANAMVTYDSNTQQLGAFNQGQAVGEYWIGIRGIRNWPQYNDIHHHSVAYEKSKIESAFKIMEKLMAHKIIEKLTLRKFIEMVNEIAQVI